MTQGLLDRIAIAWSLLGVAPLLAVLLSGVMGSQWAVLVRVEPAEGDLTAADVRRELVPVVREAHGLSVLDDESLFASGAVEALELVRDCGPDETCLVDALDRAQLDRVLLVLLSLEADEPFLALWVVDRAARKVTARWAGTISKGDPRPRLRREVSAALAAAGHVRWPRLVLAPEPADASLRLDGAPVESGARFVPPGPHTIAATRDGYVSRELSLTLATGSSTVAIALEPESRGSGPWIWWVAGAIVAAAAVVTVALVAVQDRCVCAGVDASLCPPC